MMKTQIGLGVLSIPVTFDALGIVPGVICLVVVAGITTWSDYIVGVFKLKHRSVYGIDDAGQLIFGRIGREIFAAAFVLCKWLPALHFAELALILHKSGFSLPAQACSAFPLVSTLFRPTGLYCNLCRSGRCHRMLPGQYSDFGPH